MSTGLWSVTPERFLGLTRSIRLFRLCRQSHGGCHVHQHWGVFPHDPFQLRVAAPQFPGLAFAAGQNLPQFAVLAENVPGCVQPFEYRAQFFFGDRLCDDGRASGLQWFSSGGFFPHRLLGSYHSQLVACRMKRTSAPSSPLPIPRRCGTGNTYRPDGSAGRRRT